MCSCVCAGLWVLGCVTLCVCHGHVTVMSRSLTVISRLLGTRTLPQALLKVSLKTIIKDLSKKFCEHVAEKNVGN